MFEFRALDVKFTTRYHGLDMNLATILGFVLLSLALSPCAALGFFRQAAALVPVTPSNSNAAQAGASAPSSGASSSQPQAAPTDNSSSTKTAGSQRSAKPNPTSAKPHAKKTIYPDCSNGPTPLKPVLTAGKAARPDASQTAANSGLANGNAAKSASSSHSKPCPPAKKVVRNGGADEPKIELLGGSPAEQASSERSTEQITATTEENLKKISERQLNSGEKETVSQIRQFIEQSKQAVAAGDPERARNLATKARLLSEELVGP